MIIKIAFNNVKKSYRDFSVYFLTLTLSVAILYVFGSFQDQSIILQLTQETESMVQILGSFMVLLSGLTVFIFAMLILYANRFLIRRRKKEIGLYLVLGMKRRNISWMLILETFFIGFVSLFTGLLVGFILSQITSVMIGNLLDVPIAYSFVFSANGAKMTILCFLVIYLLVLILNQRSFRKVELSQIFTRFSEEDGTQVKHLAITILWAILSLFGLIVAYMWALKPMHLFLFLPVIVGLGSFSTFKLFQHVGTLVGTLIRKIRPIYYHEINVFVTRQLTSMFKQSYKLMALVSITLLFGMSVMTVGVTLRYRLDTYAQQRHPYDLTFIVMNDQGLQGVDVDSLPQNVLDNTQSVQELVLYRSDSWSSANIWDLQTQKQILDDRKDATAIVDLESFNNLRKSLNQPLLELERGQAYMQPYRNEEAAMNRTLLSYAEGKEPVYRAHGASYPLKIYDPKVDTLTPIQNGEFPNNIMVLNQEDVDFMVSEGNGVFSRHITNFTLKKTDKDSVLESSTSLKMYAENHVQAKEIFTDVRDIYSAIDGNNGATAIATFSGVYIGFVLLIVSGAILSLHQLSQVDDSVASYQALYKLGVDDKMVNRAIFRQCFVYYGVPLIVGVIHSIVGIIAINANLGILFEGKTDVISSLIVIGMIVILYLVYFMMTYENSKRILINKGFTR